MIIDTDHLERATAGDHALQAELLRLFREQLGDASMRSHEADLVGSLHRLKGASHAVGAKTLAAAIVDAEAALRRGMPEDSLDTDVPHLRAAIDQARIAVDGLLAAPRLAGLAKAGESG